MEDPNADETSQEASTTPAGEPPVEAPPLADGAREIAPQMSADAGSAAEQNEDGELQLLNHEAPSDPEDASSGSDPDSEAEAGSASPETGEALPDDELGQLAARAQQGRLALPDEDRAKALLKEALIDGKAKAAQAAALLPRFAWVVAVDAVTGAWPEMKATARTQLLKALAEEESDQVRRMRLSLARGLFKIDIPAALKVAVAVARDLKDKETGAVPPKRAQIFSNVFIGKAKPWLAQLPLGELKPADADLLVHTAVLSAFSLPHPPVTQLGVLKWAAEGGRLAKVQETALEAIVKAVARWSAKWQGMLRKEVADLPEPIAAALRPPASERPDDERKREDSPEPVEPVADPTGEGAVDEAAGGEAEPEKPRKERPVYEPRPQRTIPSAEPQPAREQQKRERPVYEPRSSGRSAQSFNLPETLRQIEAHVESVRSELAAAQAKLRQREDDGRRGRRGSERPSPIVEGEPTLEELARSNQQLDARNAELQARITELLADSEDRAVSTGAMAGESIADAASQLRTLLALKLQEDYADHLALEKEEPDIVVQQHYKALLKDVFEILLQEGVPLRERAPE